MDHLNKLPHIDKPLYEDTGCESCHFINTYQKDNTRLDAWICLPDNPKHTISLIVRYGNIDHEYWSMCSSVIENILNHPTDHRGAFESPFMLIAMEMYARMDEFKKKFRK